MDSKEEVVKMIDISRASWKAPLKGIPAVIGYALLAFNVVLINLYPENSVSFAYVNAIGMLVLFGLIHALFHLYTGALNQLEREKLVSVLKILNSLAELDGTSDDEDGLSPLEEESNE